MSSGIAGPDELELTAVGSAAGPASGEQVEEAAAELARHVRLMHLLKSDMIANAPEGLEWGAHAVLALLVKGGAMGQKALADCTMLDPSTVSRRVAQLVAGGYVERRPDPADGRAVQLAVTPSGLEMHQRFAEHRAQLMSRFFDDWSAVEVTTFLGLFRRLNDRIDAVRPTITLSTSTKES